MCVGGVLPLFLGLASTLLSIKVASKLSHSAPWSPLQSQGGAGRGWGDRSGARGPGQGSYHAIWGWGKEIKGFSLSHSSETILQSVRAHGRGSCWEAPASTGSFASQVPLQLWECSGTNVSQAAIACHLPGGSTTATTPKPLLPPARKHQQINPSLHPRGQLCGEDPTALKAPAPTRD